MSDFRSSIEDFTRLDRPAEYPDEMPALKLIGGAVDPILQRVFKYRETARQLMGLCESPIEEALGVAILDLFEWRTGYISVIQGRPNSAVDTPVVLIPQFKWSFYRSDFALLGTDVSMGLLIECDGREFHSSPKQREHDLRKDTAARQFELQTIRFTGKEIYADALECARRARSCSL